MSETLFSKIIRREIPAHVVYEDAAAIAFLDIHPIAKGHTLVVPKEPAATIFDLSGEAFLGLMKAVRATTERLQTVLTPDGFTIGWNHGEAGGQAIPHVHVHILPRWHGDGGKSMHAVVDAPGEEPPEELIKRFA